MSNILTLGAGSNIVTPTQIYNVLQSAMRKTLVWRNLAAIVIPPAGIPGSAVFIPLQDVDAIEVHQVAEGAEAPMDSETYARRTITPLKYMVNIGITKEMVEDSQFAVITLNTQTAGYALAKNEDSLVETNLSANAGTTVALAGAVLSYSDIPQAMKALESNNFVPRAFVISTDFAEDIRNMDTFVEADKAGITDPSKRLIGTMFGMTIVISTNLTANTGYVIDPDHSFAIGEKRVVSLEGFDDIRRDMHHIVASQRVAVSYLWANATCKIA